jgi:hypothetical protein
VRSRAAKSLPTDEKRPGELARLCTLVLDEARGLLEPLSTPASFQRLAAENQVLNLQSDAAGFCARFLFFFAHVAPDEPYAPAQQFLSARPHVLELYRLLELWAPKEDGFAPWLAHQARACLLAFGLPAGTPLLQQCSPRALLH